MANPDARLRQMEESLMVPIIMLALLHARDIELGKAPLLKASEALYEWSDLARELTLWYGTFAIREARLCAEELVARFVTSTARPPIVTGLHDKVIGQINPPAGDAA